MMDYSIILDYHYSNYATFSEDDFDAAVDEIFVDILFDDFAEYMPNKPDLKIGYMQLHYYNMHLAIDNDINLFYTFDRSVNTVEMGEILIDIETGNIKDEIIDTYESNNLNLMVLYDFGIYPEYRCKGYGRQALNGLIKHFAGKCGYIVLKSFPLQHESEHALGRSAAEMEKMNLQLLEQGERKAQKQLNKFYRECGFTPLLSHRNYFIYNYI